MRNITFDTHNRMTSCFHYVTNDTMYTSHVHDNIVWPANIITVDYCVEELKSQ